MNPDTITDWLAQCALPRLEARMLLQHFTGLTHAQILTHGQQRLPEKQWAALQQAAAKRQQGEPMAYILGEREFYGRRFEVTPDVLIPRPETEHLVDAALSRLPPDGALWDLGTGSGAIAVTLACERPDARIWASDVSANALTIAKRNADAFQATITLGWGSWFDANPRPQAHSLDVLISNPPYIESQDHHLQQGDLRFEPRHALTDFADGLSAIRTIIAQAPCFLKPAGWLMLEHGFDQGQAVRTAMEQQGFQHVQTQQDWANLDRLTLGQMA